MRIAVSAQDDRGLDGVVAYHFGRCPFYVFVDVEGQRIADVNVMANPYYNKHQPNKVPYFIQQQGAQVMVAGGMGRRAIQLFDRMNIDTHSGAAGTIRRVVQRVTDGQLTGAAPCRERSKGEPSGLQEDQGHQEEHGEIGRVREEVSAMKAQVEQATKRLDSLRQSESQ